MARKRESPPEALEGPGTKDVAARTGRSESTPTLWTVGPSPGLEKGGRREERHKPEGHPNSEAWRRYPPTEGPPSERSRPATCD